MVVVCGGHFLWLGDNCALVNAAFVFTHQRVPVTVAAFVVRQVTLLQS